MSQSANENARFFDPDDNEDARLAARYAKIRHAARDYAGRTDLLDLGIAVCRELRQAQGELEASKGKRADLRQLVSEKSDQLAAIETVMDEQTRVRLWDAIAHLPVLR